MYLPPNKRDNSSSSSDCESCCESRNYESSDDSDFEPTPFIHPNPNTFNSHQQQNFSLPNVLIHYISMNPKSPKGLEKLQKTCKYFFAKNKIVIVDEKVELEKNYIYCYGLNLNLKEPTLIKYWLTKTIKSFGQKYFMESIFRFSIRHIFFSNLTFTLNEFNFILGDAKIHSLELDDVNIYDDHDEMVKFDQIMSKIPYVRKLEYFCNKNEIFSTETFENLCSMKFNCKFKHFDLHIYNLSTNADVTPFCNFFQTNIARGAYTYIKVSFKINNSDEILEKMESDFQSWIKVENKKKFQLKKCGQAIVIMKH